MGMSGNGFYSKLVRLKVKDGKYWYAADYQSFYSKLVRLKVAERYKELRESVMEFLFQTGSIKSMSVLRQS